MVSLNYQHAELASGRWKTFTLCEQLANVGSEVFRALSWQHDPVICKAAFYRALELMDLTIQNATGFYRLRELARIRELLTDYFTNVNEYQTSSEYWKTLFMQFTTAAAIERKLRSQ